MWGYGMLVQRELREQLIEACRVREKPAAQVVREFMRAFVTKGSTNLQARLDETIDDCSMERLLQLPDRDKLRGLGFEITA